MELTGIIIEALPVKSGVSQRTGNVWMSREYVIEVQGQYVKKCCFRVFGEDRIKSLNIQLNETLTIQFDIDAHEYQGRWFNEVNCYNILRQQQPVQAEQPAAQPQQDLFPPSTDAATAPVGSDDEKPNDLPF